MMDPELIKRSRDRKYLKELEQRKQDILVLASKFKHHVSELDILRWLHNFDESDRDDALKILFAVDYLDETDIMVAYDAGLAGIVESFPQSQLLILPVGAYGKSATAMVYYLKKTGTYRKHKNRITLIPNTNQLAEHLNGHNVIVLLDDFFGSGNSVVEFYEDALKDKLESGSYRKLYLLSAAAQKDSIHRLHRRIPGCEVLYSIHRDKAFSDSGSPFGYQKTRLRIREMCYRYGKGLFSISKKDYPLGYGNSQALTVFSYGTPNNTLPILWASNKKWVPLFPRSFEPRMNHAKAFRKETAYMLSIAKTIGLEGFASGTGSTNWKQYQFITRSDFLKFSFIRLKNQKRAEHVICQLLGLTQQDYGLLLASLIQGGFLDSEGRLTPYGQELYHNMADAINHFKKSKSTVKIKKEAETLYLPETFRGTR
jgi:hypothetical protein